MGRESRTELDARYEAQYATTVAPQERISWGAILGGAVTALAIATLLYSLGFALGLSAIDPSNPSSLRASSLFTGIWSLVTAFVALFAGGLVASRVAGVSTRTGGAIHGLVMWSLTTIAGTFLVFNLLAHALGAAAAVGKVAIQGGASAAGEASGVAAGIGVDFDDVLAPINRKLQAAGKPAVTAGQIEAASKDALQDAVRQGRLDRQLLISSIADKTNLSRADAADLATRVQDALVQTRDRASSAVTSLEAGALRAAESSGKAFWGAFGALLIGMISAVLGAMLGVSKRQRMRPPPPDRGLPIGEPGGFGGAFGPGHPRTYP